MSTERTTAEKVTMLFSLGILIGILALTSWASVRDGGSRPIIAAEAHLDQVRVIGTAYYVPVTITNTGGLTAQDVTVTGELRSGDGEVESADITIAFLAGGESEKAELIFTTDPANGDLRVVPVSFVMP